MAVPVIAIVGRPNVGKSSLFNWLAGRRISIVDPTAGVTRDRISTLIQVGERFCELVDTGGMFHPDPDELSGHVEGQIDAALQQAAVILFVTDGRAGITHADSDVATRLRGCGKPVITVVNKCDTILLEDNAGEFFRLGYKPLLTVSAEQRRGKDELLEAIGRALPEATDDEEAPEEPALKLAIVGRRNTGKSTFINSLARSERMIVSEVAGTTRDSVDVRFERDDKTFIAIDTAGVRRKSSIANDVEFYSLARAERSIRRADVVLLFFDARLRISKVDKQLAGYVLDQHKPAVFVINKWDLARASVPTEKFANYVRATFPMLDYLPIAFITAQSGKNVHALLHLTQALAKQARARVGTGELNRVIKEAMEANPPPLRQNRRARVYYATQVDAAPPTIVLFINSPELFDDTWLRYLHKYLRDHLPFHEVPLKLHLRAKKRDEDAPPPDDDTRLDLPAARPLTPPEPASSPRPARKRRKRSDAGGTAPAAGGLWDV